MRGKSVPYRRFSARWGLLLLLLLIVGVITAGGMLVMIEPVDAHIATGPLSIEDASVTTDNGKIESFTLNLTDGHASYDGLETEAAVVEVAVFAAPAGGDLEVTDNRIAADSHTVDETSSMGTYAGDLDFTFDGIDILSADDLSKKDFEARSDGSTKETDVDMRLTVSIQGTDGTVLITGDDRTTVTVTVTNEESTTDILGSGDTTVTGPDQRP